MSIFSSGCRYLLLAVYIASFLVEIGAFRVLEPGERTPNGTYFRPYARGFTGIYGDPTNFQRERINEGAYETSDQELLFEGVSPRQACPGMVGPFSDGSFYCTAREYGYCDRRSGTCFCNIGYRGIDCSECQDSHYRVGTLCYPKKLCPADCSGSGTCNFNNGTCTCYPHRTGVTCEKLLCTVHSPLCEACTDEICLKCASGYYLTLDEDVCSTCYDFDPRCAGCTKEEGCTVCADSTLTSVRRSGYRAADPLLAQEENTREFGITLPFGTKSPESFADSEDYVVVTTPDRALRNNSISCTQGLMNDESWSCERFETSHIVCGHYGVFTFVYPNYAVSERAKNIRMQVRRTGGGFGDVFINYFIKHFTTNDSDLIATAAYTTSQRLSFENGVVERSFLITILDDNIVEEDEVFQVILEVPEGGGSVGAQFRTNVTILDDDADLLSHKLTESFENTTRVRAGDSFATTVHAVAANGQPLRMGGDQFFAVVENNVERWTNTPSASGTQRHAVRSPCPVADTGNGSYSVNCPALAEQGEYQLRVFHAFPGSIMGEYYNDAFFEVLAVRRLDQAVNFTWGAGRLIPRGADYISVRWSGALMANETGMYQFKVEADDHARLWVDGILLLDHWYEQYVNLQPPRDIFLQGGQLHEVVLEYREVRGEAYARLLWGFEGSTMGVVSQDNLYSLFEIDRSPVEVSVYSADTAANTTECTGEGLFEAVALNEARFSFCPRDRFRNLRDDDDLFFLRTDPFSANLTLLDDLGHNGIGSEFIAPTLVYNVQTHCFDGSYTAGRAGKYELSIIHHSTPGSRDFEEGAHVAGSPFYPIVRPDRMSGPKSLVHDLPNPLYGEAGHCYNFTVVARDNAENYLMYGGDDLQAYMFRVDYYTETEGQPMDIDTSMAPSSQPTSTPTAAPSGLLENDFFTVSPPSDTGQDVVREGLVFDHGNGNYTVQLCPVIQGVHEVHILRGGRGVSNQPTQILARWQSRKYPSGEGTYRGQYVAGSPYPLVVSHTVGSGLTSTAEGPGLIISEVGVQTSFLVTVRDPWENVLRTAYPPVVVTAELDRSPNATVDIWDYHNGSYLVQYTPLLSGFNYISVFVDGFQIRNSPFITGSLDGVASGQFSYAVGPGLISGVTGEPSYFEVYAFDLEGNRQGDNDDIYVFIVDDGILQFTGQCKPCPLPPLQNHPICSPLDAMPGHYFCVFTPTVTGPIEVSVYLQTTELRSPEDLISDPIDTAAEVTNSSSNSTAGGGRRLTLDLHQSQHRFLQSEFNETFCNTTAAQNSTAWGALCNSTAVKEEDIVAGDVLVFILTALGNSPFRPIIFPSGSKAEDADVSGTLYDNVAGVPATVEIHLRDYFGNLLQTGGKSAELVLLGVAVEWGTPEPLPEHHGLPNEHFYRGFYAGYPNVYGTVTDLLDGRYVFRYNVLQAGQYVMRLSMAEEGLNATYFNTTDFGNLFDGNFNYRSFELAQQGQDVNLGSSISWTGDLGRRQGVRGSVGESTFYHRFLTRTERGINVDLRGVDVNDYLETISLFPLDSNNSYYKYRDEFWSARWTGLITPPYAEVFTFDVEVDHDSTVLMRLGGRGLEFNNSEPGEVVLAVNRSSRALPSRYNFSDTISREFLVDYAHFSGDAVLKLYWESPSTPRELVPRSAFTHWRNISHFNTTIHPAPLCSGCSTAYGAALHEAQVAVKKSFWVYARDEFENLLQRGGDVPSMVAVGRDGIAFRGDVTDYGNSTYLIEYYPTQAGSFRMYVTMGCCPPHRDVGYPAEIQQMTHLLIKDAPFLLTIEPAPIDQSRSVAVGGGLIGGIVGEMHSFTTLFRDVHNNPTAVVNASQAVVTTRFVNRKTSSELVPDSLLTASAAMNTTVSYNITRAGTYFLYVYLSDLSGAAASVAPKQVVASPFHVIMHPSKPAAEHTVCRGIGLRQAVRNKTASFEIQLYDVYRNNLEVGGDKFFIRLQGDANFTSAPPLLERVPRCTDTQNGRYVCTYSPLYGGTHQLVVKLLNNSVSQPGGLGLSATYYASYDGATSGASDATDSAIFTRIDPTVSFAWPTGIIVPSSTLPSGVSQPLRVAGQSVRWEGYIFAPRTDYFTFSAVLRNMHAEIYLDQQLVFDSANQLSVAVSLVTDSSYHLRVLAYTNATLTSTTVSRGIDVVFEPDVAIDLQWSTPTIRPYTVPQFFLYDSAQDVVLSPFPVLVA